MATARFGIMTLPVAVVMCLAPLALAQNPPLVNIRGNWTIHSVGGDGVAAVQRVQMNQNVDKISGHFEGPHQSGGVQGQLTGRHIEFSTRTRDVLTLRGEVDGNTMQGTFGNRGVHGTWRAERAQ